MVGLVHDVPQGQEGFVEMQPFLPYEVLELFPVCARLQRSCLYPTAWTLVLAGVDDQLPHHLIRIMRLAVDVLFDEDLPRAHDLETLAGLETFVPSKVYLHVLGDLAWDPVLELFELPHLLSDDF